MRARRLRGSLFVALALAGAGLAWAPALAQPGPPPSAPKPGGLAYSIELRATINPATERWVSSALDDAESQGAKLAIIELDTQGGLSDSMRSIIRDMLAAPMAVVVYVSPGGARASSEGVYITEAADVAAMAPDTTIGSAASTSIDVRALTSRHGRNANFAQQMVARGINVTAQGAERAGLIDLIAPDELALAQRLDGFQVRGPKAQVLHTPGLRIERHDLPLQYELLEILVNPTVAYLLLLLGLLGLGIELWRPGLIIPGTMGLISFLLGIYGSAQLPVTAAGALLMALGVAVIIAEGYRPTRGILGAAGVGALIVSGLLLYDTDSSAFEVSAPAVVAAGLLLGGAFAFAVERAIRVRRRPVRTGGRQPTGEMPEGDRVLEERFRALSELSAALLGQVKRAKEEFEELAPPPDRDTFTVRGQMEEPPAERGHPPSADHAGPSGGAPSRHGTSSDEALLRAAQMAVAGSERPEIEAALRREFGVDEPAAIVDQILGSTG